jgi:phosphatidylinositol alpha 1,6-mannosyltransferase
VKVQSLTYVALGDSFSAGHNPRLPRWPDQVALALGPGTRYENLAAVGATSEDVERRQLPRALTLRPDLVTLVCGANDVLLSVRPDPAAYRARLERMLARLSDELPGALLVTATYPDLAEFVELRPRSRARVHAGIRLFNEACRAAARDSGAMLLEGFGHPAVGRRESFADDGFHPSEEGHRHAAIEFVRAVRQRLAV